MHHLDTTRAKKMNDNNLLIRRLKSREVEIRSQSGVRDCSESRLRRKSGIVDVLIVSYSLKVARRSVQCLVRSICCQSSFFQCTMFC